jgi:hypothetical protein
MYALTAIEAFASRHKGLACEDRRTAPAPHRRLGGPAQGSA